ncbi:MAG TPA: HepT-like ribonuclease domain-containing protein [Actinomycetota bacterium]|nr:HepT-like ribonuclease domain-containing protein [Actinomycetota bacterium]
MRGDRDRLADILEALARIRRHATGRESFAADELAQTWVVHHLEIFGEAARSLSQEARSRSEGVPWAEIIAMRNVLVHRYFEVDVEQVWRVVESLPDLETKIRALMGELEA